MTIHHKQRLEECRKIERELRLRNAELQVEIEKSRSIESILRESCQILSLVAEISKDIVERGENLDIYTTLEKIGKRLSLNKIFLFRFSRTIEPHIEWHSNKIHKSEFEYHEDLDLVPLMNWVYEKKCYSGPVNDLPKFFSLLCCPKGEKQCDNCNMIIVPIIIEKKPWGLMGFAKTTDSNASDLTKKSIINLCNLLSILIQRKEENDHLSNLIDKKLSDFRDEIKVLRGGD